MIYQIRLAIVIGEPEWCLMAHKVLNSLTTIILSSLFPLAQWVTIEMPSNSPPKFLANAKHTPWTMLTNLYVCGIMLLLRAVLNTPEACESKMAYVF